MPKNKKDESSSESDSGPDDRDPPPKKSKAETDKKSKADADKKSKGNADKKSKGDDDKKSDFGTGQNEWVLENMRMARINEFRGRKMIDIREHYEKDGKIMPGKKGISLSAYQWRVLLDHADEITKALN